MSGRVHPKKATNTSARTNAALMSLLDSRRKARMGARMIPRSVPRAARQITLKGVDTDISIVANISTTNTNAQIFTVNLVQQGAGSWNRVGRKLHLKSLRLKGVVQFTINPSATTGTAVLPGYRCIVVWDKQPSGTAIPAFDQIFGITAQDGTETCPTITCPPRYDNMDRFRIMKDMFYDAPNLALSAIGTGPNTAVNIEMDEYISLPSLETVFSGQSAPMTIADISTGALYVIHRQTSAAGGASSVTFSGIARIRYTD